MSISKSQYLVGRQCDRRFWLASVGESLYGKEPAMESDNVWELREAEGAEVERLVESLYEAPLRIAAPPDDETVESDSAATTSRRAATVAALQERRPLFQAHLAADDLAAIVDVLEPCGSGWRLWEVKASTKPLPLYDHDLAFQVEVARRQGIEIVGAGLWLLNPTYVRGLELVPRELLVPIDRTTETQALAAGTRVEIDRQLALRDCHDVPAATPGPQCKGHRAAADGDRPSSCGQLAADGYCGQRLPEAWVGTLPRLTPAKWGLFASREISAIPEIELESQGESWTELQHRVITAVQERRPIVDRPALRAMLDRLEWPVAYVDFEFDPGMAIPRYPGMRPYERLPFQWSMHVQYEPNGPLERPDPFLHVDATDPRRAFLESLLGALPDRGSVVVHFQPAEKTVLLQLAAAFGAPDQDRITGVVARLYDTLQLLRAGYYHPGQGGSYSIKKVAPVLAGRGYDDLRVQDGMAAVAAWKRLVAAGTPQTEKAAVAADLRAYCGRDTELLHALVEAVRQLVA